ncbi:protein pangolin, isoforms A/H/I/S-like [Apis mellifera carnica]|nr:protein pangolin, isoforms A/H/I/S-like [Apis mellifera carnica]
MPHVSSSGGGDDLGSEDEVKVFKDEGEDEKRSSENLTEEKSSLIDLTESEEKGSLAGGSYSTTGKTSARSDLSPVFGKVDPTPHTSSFNMGYLVSPYPYPNGAGGPIPVSMVSVYHFIVSRIVLPVRRKQLKDVSTKIRFETFPLVSTIFIYPTN